MSRVLVRETGWCEDISVPQSYCDQFSDVTIITNDNRKLFAHSSLLSASPVLSRCLSFVDIRVSRDISIILEYPSAIACSLLNFLYTGYANIKKHQKEDFVELCTSLRLNPNISFTDLDQPEEHVISDLDFSVDKTKSSIKLNNHKDEVSGSSNHGKSESVASENIKKDKTDSSFDSAISVSSENTKSVPNIHGKLSNTLEEKIIGIRSSVSKQSSTTAKQTIPISQETSSETISGFVTLSKTETKSTNVNCTSTSTLLPTTTTSKSSSAESLKNAFFDGNKAKADNSIGSSNEHDSVDYSTNDKGKNNLSDNIDDDSNHLSNYSKEVVKPSAAPLARPYWKDLIAKSDPFANMRSGLLDLASKKSEPASHIKNEEQDTSQLGLDIPLICDICFKIFVGEPALNKHKLSEHPMSNENSDESGEEVNNSEDEMSEVDNPDKPLSNESCSSSVSSNKDLHQGDSDKNRDTIDDDGMDNLEEAEDLHDGSDVSKDEDEETTERISDFLSLLNEEQKKSKKSGKSSKPGSRKKSKSSTETESAIIIQDQTEDSVVKEFKMPENFDIPHDYIQQIVPRAANRESYQLTSPDHNPSLNTSSPEHITYYAKDNSSRNKNKGRRRHASGDLKFNRKRKSYMSQLFEDDNSQESDVCTVETEPGIIPTVRREFETCGGTATMLSIQTEPPTTPTKTSEQVSPDPNILTQLEDKKERIKRKLLEPDSDQDEYPAALKEKRKKKKKKSRTESNERPASAASSTKSNRTQSPSPSYKSTPSSSSHPNKLSKHAGGTGGADKPKNTLKYKSEGKSKAPFKFSEDWNWLVNDSYEDSSDSERRRRKEKKKKKRRRQEETGETDDSDKDQDTTDEDERRKRLDARKKRKGGDVLAWMSRRPKVSVKYWEKGVETIVEKCIYKMNLLGAEDSSSSGVEEELRRRDRVSSSSDEPVPKLVKSPSPVKKRKHKKHKKEKSDHRSEARLPAISSDEDVKKKKALKRTLSLQEDKQSLFQPIATISSSSSMSSHRPQMNRSVSSFSSFKIPKLFSSKPS